MSEADASTFSLPDLGEGLTEAEIVSWLVAVGDEIAVDQPVAEVETAKASVEVPSPYGGTVTGLHGAVGEVVAVGAPLITVVPAAGLSEPGGRAPANTRTTVPDAREGPGPRAATAPPEVTRIRAPSWWVTARDGARGPHAAVSAGRAGRPGQRRPAVRPHPPPNPCPEREGPPGRNRSG